MSAIYNRSGGYRKLHSFNFATIVHLGTMDFCKRFVDWKADPLGKTTGQMVGASRSGKQNIIEGSERAGTSAETEIKLTDVAKASLCELQGDLEDYLAHQNQIPWSVHSNAYQRMLAIRLSHFVYSDDVLHDHWKYLLAEKGKFDEWLRDDDPVVVANALIVLIQRTVALLGSQLRRLESEFVANGGIRERMTKARIACRDTTTPDCPDCGTSMRRRRSERGDFWGCATYPQCRGTRKILE